ncbi:MAG TPA: hypothetical protein VIK53_08980 [Verrucomicrobiae bacterium]
MKKQNPSWKLPACLAATALALLSGAATIQAATALNANLTLRPLSAVDVANPNYALPSNSELSGGLNTVGVGTAVYLEAEVNIAIPTADITNVTWSLTVKPVGSTAVLTTGPLGANIPIYEPSTRLVAKVAGRQLLRPDMPGRYTVTATISTASSGTTNVSQTITAGTYMGVQTCALCHSGGIVAEDKYTTWSQTLHSHIFSDEINGLLTVRQSCLQCHTTGFSANTNVMDGGFSSLQLQLGWTIPTVLTNGNWAALQAQHPDLANVANVTCESCHGPGSQHANLFGNTNSPSWPGISVNMTSGDCNQCHDDATHHPYGTEWLHSEHAITTTTPSGAGRQSCVGCHTAAGFIGRIDGVNVTNLDTTYMPINCQTCHEPHGDTVPANNPHMIRAMTSVTFPDGTVVKNGGEGLLCMECHQSRQNATNYANVYSSNFGPHHGPQGDMLEGVNGFNYGQVIPSSAHANAVTNSCVTCHMQNISSSDPAFTFAGGHTFAMSSSNEMLVAACQQCHGSTLTSFNFPLQDYNGDGVVEGVQTEVQHLLDKVSTLLPNASGVVDGLIQSPSPKSTWTAPQLEADYNYQFVQNDGSLGIHNTAYAVGLLKASIASLTGISSPGGLPDAWVIKYFGSLTNAAAAPNAINNVNGLPNWMMYALGLSPFSSSTAVNGVIYVNNGNIVNGATNTVAIYTAAEIAFNTKIGTTYTVQGISALTGTWSNISTNIPGTGSTISYLTPTRNNTQMFYRVVSQ